MKLLKLQNLMCMGGSNDLSSMRKPVGRGVDPLVKIIKWDGVVILYRRRIRASELMNQFPNHLVCDSQSFYIGQKIPPLGPRDKLHLGRNYFLLPMDAFQSVLSFVSITSSFAAFNMAAPVSSCQAFDVRKAPSGYLQIRVSDEFVSNLIHRQPQDLLINSPAALTGKILCSTPQLHKEYTQLVVSSQKWKPKLEIIKESKKKLSSSSFRMIIKRRKKTQSKPKPTPKSKPKSKSKRQKIASKIKIRTK